MSALGAFAIGVWFGVCLTLIVEMLIVAILRDESEDHDDWDPWGGQHKR